MALDLAIQFELSLGPSGPLFVAADATGHTFANDGNVAIWVHNNTLNPLTLTMLSARHSDFGPYPSREIEIAASTLYKTSTWHSRRFTDERTGRATFTLSVTSGVLVAAVAQQQIYKDS